MKFKLFLMLILPSICFSQQFESRTVLNDNFNFRKAIVADFDNDGRLDIATSALNNISWHKNLDGLGTFSDPIPIQLNLGQSFDLVASDLNNNGHLDVIVTFFDNDFVAWYPNDGFGNFGSGITVTSGLNKTISATPADINQDGWTDLIIGITNGNGFYWAENPANSGPNWTLHTIDPWPSQARKQIVADLDEDGDIDIFTRVSGADFYWYENIDGNGQNWNPTFIQSDIGESYLFIDLDGNNLKDILSVSNFNKVLWLKNLSGGNFDPPQIIHTETSNIGYLQVFAFDVNNNGFMDVVASTSHVLIENNKLVWFENLDGQGNFGSPQIIDTHTQFITSIVGADFDSDGYTDIAVTLTGPDVRGLFWYKNKGMLNTSDFEVPKIKLYPNPVNNTLNIESSMSLIKATFYNTIGQIVLTVKKDIQSIDISHFTKGLYFLELETVDNKTTLKLIKQ